MKNLKLGALTALFGVAFQIQICCAQTAPEFIERAQAAQAKGDYGEMIKNAGEAVRQDSGSALAFFLRGLGYFLTAKNEEAAADAAKVIELNPNIAEAYFLHGSALTVFRPEDWKIALADYDKAIAINPTFSIAFRARARIHNEYDKNFAAALADANQAVKLDADYADALFERGRANGNLKNWADAESDYSAAIKLGKKTALIYNLRGVVSFMQNKMPAAIADFRKSLELEPDNKQAKENLELALAKPPATDSGNSAGTASAASPGSQSNISFAYAFNSNLYEKSMPAAEQIFRKLSTHRYAPPKTVSFMGRTATVDAFGEDKNKLALRLNNALLAMHNILESRYVNELTDEQRRLCRERLDKAVALQAEAARLHLVTLVREN